MATTKPAQVNVTVGEGPTRLVTVVTSAGGISAAAGDAGRSSLLLCNTACITRHHLATVAESLEDPALPGWQLRKRRRPCPRSEQPKRQRQPRHEECLKLVHPLGPCILDTVPPLFFLALNTQPLCQARHAHALLTAILAVPLPPGGVLRLTSRHGPGIEYLRLNRYHQQLLQAPPAADEPRLVKGWRQQQLARGRPPRCSVNARKTK